MTTIFRPCRDPWGSGPTIPRAASFAVTDLGEATLRLRSELEAADNQRASLEAQLQAAAAAGYLTNDEPARITALLDAAVNDRSNVDAEYYSALLAPDGSELAATIFGLARLHARFAAQDPADAESTMTESDVALLVGGTVVFGAPFGIGVLIGMASEHIHVTID